MHFNWAAINNFNPYVYGWRQLINLSQLLISASIALEKSVLSKALALNKQNAEQGPDLQID